METVFTISVAASILIMLFLVLRIPSKNIYHITYVTQKGYNTPVYHSNFIEGIHPVAWILERKKTDVYTKYHIVHYDRHPSYKKLMKVQEDMNASRGYNGNGQEASNG